MVKPRIRMTGRRKGRTSTFTSTLAHAIARNVAKGARLDEAAAACGVAEPTLRKWLRIGSTDPSSPQADLVRLVTEAQGKHAVAMHGTVSKAGKREWKAAAESLRLANWSRYGQSRIEFHVAEELRGALDRLKLEFENEPATLERILACVAGVAGLDGTSSHAPGPSAGADSATGPVDPDATLGAAIGVPRPLV